MIIGNGEGRGLEGGGKGVVEGEECLAGGAAGIGKGWEFDNTGWAVAVEAGEGLVGGVGGWDQGVVVGAEDPE